MTTEREYQEGQRRVRKVRKQHRQTNNQFLWIFMGIIVFIGLITVQFSQNRSPQTIPSNSNQVSQ
ncbi:hypothetical protein cce_1033 [Crocosphaera subtropica ATCC 51142]|uniref:Uncharacterized protein n=1 Tax=Crocosphaera subtropica (strain ATCC 51142 / BH68) TaxID=43989 RepID=B1WTR8_CROS5|nr:hypothetical protein [Crocosphaera subtropica]ACB50384.1 hypothetical protein cce_1033 [Crocosphaera subtropica ATCC 51142]